MPFKCSVPECKLNYDSEQKSEGFSVSLYKFPKPDDTERLNKWIRKIPRQWSEKDLHSLRNNPSNCYRVCASHFEDRFFISDSQDKNIHRKRQSATLHVRKLTLDAFPSLFPKTPSYLSDPITPKRTDATSAEHRFNAQREAHEIQIETFFNNDKLSSYQQLSSHELPPHLLNISKVYKPNMCAFLFITFDNSIPHIEKSLTIDQELYVTVSHDGVLLKTFTADILVNSKLESFSQLNNLLTRLNNLSTLEYNHEHFIEKALPILSCAIESAENGDLGSIYSKLSFLEEQLKLLLVHKSKYSSDLLSLSYLLQNHSPSAYTFLQDSECLTLPSKRHLQRLSSSFSNNPDESAMLQYLSVKVNGLTPQERLVIINIDEIHSSKKVEFSGGQCYGTEKDSTKVAKTVCAVLIKSVLSNYQEIISLLPVSNLDSSSLHQLLLDNLKLLHSAGFNPVILSVDNNSVNRKLLETTLCNGNQTSFITNPISGNPLYLLFDPVHNFKNIFNNWHTKGIFEYPDFHDPSQVLTADFTCLSQLYELEVGNPCRIAHKLNKRVLNPASLEKTNVSLACAVFDESTISAAKYYNLPEGFHNFLLLISDLWTIWNAKSSTKGRHKKLVNANPLQPNDSRIQLLRHYAEFFRHWQRLKSPGFSSQTFFALINCCETLADVSEFLFSKHSFNRILLGRFVSDWIERRFGRYRQFHGGNFFVSVRQILEAEKKIRISSLLKHNHFNLKDLISLSNSDESDRSLDLLTITLPNICHDIFSTLQSNDKNVIMYISGYICHSLRLACIHCTNLISDSKPLEFIDDLNELNTELTDLRNRGSLKYPSVLTFKFISFAYYTFTYVTSKPDYEHLIFYSPHIASILAQLCIESIHNSCDFRHLLEKTCDCQHEMRSIFFKMLHISFNIFLKNFVHEKNDNIVMSASLQRKKFKLSSCKL